ncbi:phosphoenolpyruvate--protein phosphotransferase [Arenimonas caeni]|jgi:phosphotransferase system enzyme I (PtsI)|uniref:phosphoenolpyruvate--protein phosphotransferase n=1 Tax=Arenimonas caeni TaxID=2058085 RepID=UPI002A35AEF0|nr:phosphoenolpyruvate--protein phosphotransferase [Arenimonas caeni]MDY0021658.1 phosphoenolpyruvate--protein phosphotransferase [Arenimonas caeni]
MRRALRGVSASRGIALGRARVLQPRALSVEESRIGADEVPAELARLRAALDATRAELRALRERLHGALAHEVGEFIDLHTMILDDPELLQGLEDLVRTGRYGADYALRLQRDRLAAVFEGMDDDYFRSRVEDLDHVIGRVHAALHRREGEEIAGLAGEILVCESVAPAELAAWQARGVVGVATSTGSPLSHSAILARSLHLPLLVNVPELLAHANDGDALILDASLGELVLDPGPTDLKRYHARQAEIGRERAELARLRRQPTRTRDGVDIRLYANAESREDVAEAHGLGADGVGLYRTEFLFLQRNELPTEEEQFLAYRDLVLGMAGRVATIRTLDLGADKADRTGLALRSEPNPALGLRGVRLSLAHPALFTTQLRAILRTSAYGPVRILVPMVSGREEMLKVCELLEQARAQLRTEGHQVGPVAELGAMIEVPAAALGLGDIVDLVDFVSVGTNDLVQYLLATDRNHEALAELYSPRHPAVLRLLAEIFAFGRRNGIPVAVCGEMAADAANVPLLLALGLRDFSLHPSTLLEVRKAIRDADHASLRRRATTLLRCHDRAAIERWLDRC